MTQSKHPATLHTYLSYRDANAALRWLERAFGFETTAEFPDDKGGVAHAELRREDVAIIVFSDDGAGYDRSELRGPTTGHGLYVSLPSEDAVDAVFATAVARGATEVWKPEKSQWNYRCRVLDLEGYEWTFGIHVPGRPMG
ncbi:VOC family protein [Allokutzneria multivorans]|uniref:VOC family protein n=1 Tax=Allokutzneria multivorans TaxID=1142134 RepID=A0ABP7RCF9_9PSEU